jgi:voltage-gated potassium channel
MDLKKRLLRFAYLLEASVRYKKYKKDVHEILEDNSSIKKRYFDFFMIFLVLTTILILILEIKNELPPIVYVYENIAVLIFIAEWLARFWISSDAHLRVIELHTKYEHDGKDSTFKMLFNEGLKSKLNFVISPMSIIDLLAILPSYRPLRVLRFFLLFRLFKVFRYTQSVNFLLKVFVEKKFEFLTLFMFFGFMVFFASTVIYIFEGDGSNDKINSFLDAIYWAVITITTVGFGDITPQTNEGRFVTMFLIIGGISLISFMTSIITTSMTAKLEEVKSYQVINEASKLKSFILICGYGKMGEVLSHELYRTKEKFVVIDINDAQIDLAKKNGYLALKADGSDIDILKELRCDTKLKYAVALTNDDALNLSIILSLKSLNQDITIFSRVNEKDAKDKLEIAGAKEVIFPYMVAAKAAVEYYQQPVSFSAIDNILLERYDPVIDEVDIGHDSRAKNSPLNKIGIKKHNLKVLGVIRGNKNNLIFNPKQDSFVMQEGDVLIVIGDSADIAMFKLDLFKG